MFELEMAKTVRECLGEFLRCQPFERRQQMIQPLGKHHYSQLSTSVCLDYVYHIDIFPKFKLKGDVSSEED